MMQSINGESSFLVRAAEWLLSAIGGALVTVVAFRTKIALMDKRFDDQDRTITLAAEERSRMIKQLDEEIEKRLTAIERKQSLILDVLVDIARKVGVDARFSDTVIRFLRDADAPPPNRNREVTD